MATRRVNGPEPSKRPRRPATTPLAREQQLVALAVDVAEEQMRNGTASAQVVTHFLKLGSSREHLEQEMLSENIKLAQKKREIMDAQVRIEQLYEGAISAMRAYSGNPDPPAEEMDDYDDDY